MRKLSVNHLNRRGEPMIVDNFAGGGGASTGIEMALGRSPDVAINHDPEALAMHIANHPLTRHYPTDVFEIDPRVVCRDKPVGLAWFSPDCTFFSKARGEKPIREAGKKSRGLAWVVTRWAEQVRPWVIILENVEEFECWGPLTRSGKPCPKRKGATFRKWVRSLQQIGYAVEWRQLRACDYGSPTIRKRLFVIARCDGKKIVWPEPTHSKPISCDQENGLLPWRTAAEIIDWSIPCPSIFLTPAEAKLIGCKRPLKDSTLRRIARGLQRFVIDNPKPFIVPITHTGSDRTNNIDDPLRTVTTAKRGEFSLVNPFMACCAHGDEGRYGKGAEPLESPVPTLTASKDLAIVAPYVSAYHGDKTGPDAGGAADEPIRTIDTQNRHAILAPILDRQFGNSAGASAEEPVGTVMPGGDGKTAVVTPFLGSTAHSTTTGRGPNVWTAEEPFRTITTSNDHCVMSPFAVPRYSEAEGQLPRSMSIEQPSPTVVPTGNGASLVSAFMAQHNAGPGRENCSGRELDQPLSTLMASGSQQQLVTAPLITKWRTNSDGHPIDEPLHTVTACGGDHPGGAAPFGVVAASIVGCGGRAGQSPPTDPEAPLGTVTGKADKCLAAAHLSHLRTSNTAGGDGRLEKPLNCLTTANNVAYVMAFLQKYYGSGGQHSDPADPMHTLTTKARMGLVTVQGIDYQIVDIGMRMLSPRELFSAQGFPPDYFIDVVHAGRKLPKSSQVRMCGNSVCPQVAAALVRANCPDLKVKPRKSRERQRELQGV